MGHGGPPPSGHLSGMGGLLGSELQARHSGKVAKKQATSGLCQDTELCSSVLKQGCAREGNVSLLGEPALQEGAASRRTFAAEHKELQSVLPLFVTCLPLHAAWLSPALPKACPAPGTQEAAPQHPPCSLQLVLVSLPAASPHRDPNQLPPQAAGDSVPVRSGIELRPPSNLCYCKCSVDLFMPVA